MIGRMLCRLLRHDHSAVVILCRTADGGALQSHEMDRWSADYILANVIAPTAQFAGREVVSCRIVVL